MATALKYLHLTQFFIPISHHANRDRLIFGTMNNQYLHPKENYFRIYFLYLDLGVDNSIHHFSIASLIEWIQRELFFFILRKVENLLEKKTIKYFHNSS